MTLNGITLERLLERKDIRRTQHNGKWYFSTDDLNVIYMGVFAVVGILLSPDKGVKAKKKIKMAAIEDIEKRVKEVSHFNEFDKKLFTALQFDPKK